MPRTRPHDAELVAQLMRELKASAEEGAERIHHQILMLQSERRELLAEAERRGRELAELEAAAPEFEVIHLQTA